MCGSPGEPLRLARGPDEGVCREGVSFVEKNMKGSRQRQRFRGARAGCLHEAGTAASALLAAQSIEGLLGR